MSDVRSRMSEVRDCTQVEKVMVAVHDTVMEVTTIHVRTNEAGDTIRMNVVTERDRVRSMADVRSRKEAMKIVRDTVYIERRDSVSNSSTSEATKSSVKIQGAGARASPFVSALRWIFWILICIIILVLIFKVKGGFYYGKDN